MNVFEAFPEAMVPWQWLTIKRGTEVGDIAKPLRSVNAIETEADKAVLYNTPKADSINADLLLYIRPEDLPAVTPAELMADYALQSDIFDNYDIINVGVAKNQDTGEIEHYELALARSGMEVVDE